MLGNNGSDAGSATVRRAVIGAAIKLQGEVSGSEDLVIEGAVEGVINLRENIVTVGKTAKVKADIFGKIIHVEGDVTGNLVAGEQIVIHKSGCVKGDIRSPRISLEDGARLKGAIDTDNVDAASLNGGLERSKTTTGQDADARRVVTTDAKKTNLLTVQ